MLYVFNLQNKVNKHISQKRQTIPLIKVLFSWIITFTNLLQSGWRHFPVLKLCLHCMSHPMASISRVEFPQQTQVTGMAPMRQRDNSGCVYNVGLDWVFFFPHVCWNECSRQPKVTQASLQHVGLALAQFFITVFCVSKVHRSRPLSVL